MEINVNRLLNWCLAVSTALTIICFIYVIGNNVMYKNLWIGKCKDAGGVAVTTPEGYMCVNPSAIIDL